MAAPSLSPASFTPSLFSYMWLTALTSSIESVVERWIHPAGSVLVCPFRNTGKHLHEVPGIADCPGPGATQKLVESYCMIDSTSYCVYINVVRTLCLSNWSALPAVTQLPS